MNPIDMLSAQEKENIIDYIQSYAGCGGDGCNVITDIDYLLRYWNESKSYFLFSLFKNQLIHEKRINIEMPTSILTEMMIETFYKSGSKDPFITQFTEFVERYIHKYIPYDTYCDLSCLLSTNHLCANIYKHGDDMVIPIPGTDKSVMIPVGMKLMKAVSKLVRAFPEQLDAELFEEFRIKHSQVLNQRRFSGVMGISIHPLDYMTMSDNDYNWDSCMSWQKPGEYRMGTVEMMNSECVVVGYLRGDKDMTCGYNNFNWNNKRWRQLFIVNPALIAGIKGYPYCDTLLEKEIFNMLFTLDDANTWEHDIIKVDFDTDDSTKHKGKKIQFWFQFAKMYDDFYLEHSMAFGAAIDDYLIKRYDCENKPYYSLEVSVSGHTECMTCGRDLTGELDEVCADDLMCGECSGMVHCPHCGEHYPEYEMHTLADGEEMCSSCFEYYAKACDCCGQFYYKENIYRIYAYHNGARLDEHLDICWDCKEGCGDEGICLKEMVGPIQTLSGSVFWRHRLCVDTKNFTDEGFEMFGFTKSEMEEFREEIAEYAKENLFN